MIHRFLILVFLMSFTGAGLLAAAPEVGTNDFRVSDMGANDGDPTVGAFNTAVAYNPNAHEFLVVWSGTDDTNPLVPGEAEIFGQRLDAATGAEIGANDFRISDMGLTDGDTTAFAEYPAVTHNSVDNEYIVVWNGADNAGGLAVGEREIFGQRLSATGVEVGTNDFRISDAGPDGDATFGAFHPDVAHNRDANEYLTVWFSDDDTGSLV